MLLLLPARCLSFTRDDCSSLLGQRFSARSRWHEHLLRKARMQSVHRGVVFVIEPAITFRSALRATYQQKLRSAYLLVLLWQMLLRWRLLGSSG